MISQEELRMLQLSQLDILKEIVKICDKNNLQYFIIGGTLLGAVRHRGFIPWDDDIDIAMPRYDYERFIELAKKELNNPYKILHYSTDSEYREYSLKVVINNIFCYEDKLNIEQSKTNLWIDVLPIDGVPNSKIKFFLFKYLIFIGKALLSIKNIDTIKNKSNRSSFERVIIKIAQVIPVKKLINRNFAMNFLDASIKLCDYKTCRNVGTYMGAYRFKEVVSKSFFQETQLYSFENEFFKGPKNYDDYLNHMYGDYMQLPSIEKRIAHIVKIEFHEE